MSEGRKHHPFSPSKLECLEACSCYESVSSDSEKARFGVIQHTVAETGQDDMRLSDDQAAAAAECAAFFEQKKKLWEKSGPVTELSEVYLPVDDETVEGFHGTTGGYIDKALIDHTQQQAMVFDYKFGMWQVTKASENLQGISYALGIFKAYPTVECVEFYFKQPHINSISHAVFARDDIPKLYLRVLTVVARAKQARATNDFSMARPTIPGCLFCSNIAVCPAVTEFVCKVGSKFHPIDEVIDDITPTKVHDADNSAAGMRLASLVATWASAFKNLTTERVLRGAAPVPDGYEIVKGHGKRKIIDAGKFRAAALKYLTTEVYDATVEPQLGKVEAAIKDTAPRGQKTAVVEEFKTLLVETEAVKPGEEFPYLKAKSTDDKE